MSERMQTAAANVRRNIADGEFIFQEGEVGRIAYVVEQGQVEICKQSAGEMIRLQVLEPGALFGEMALIDKAARSASARAIGDVLVREVDEQALMQHIRQAPEVALNMMHRLASYVRSSNKSLESASQPMTEEETEAIEQIEDKKGWRFWTSDQDAILAEFSSPSEAIDNKLVPRVVSLSFFVILAIIVSFVIWASISVIDTTVSARGRLVTTVPKIDVQSSGSAAIKDVEVTIGSRVKKGDLLILLDETFAEADLSRVRQELDQLDSEIYRLNAEMSDRPLETAKFINNPVQRAIFINRKNEYSSRMGSFEQDLKNLEWRLHSSRSDAALANKQLAIKNKLELVRKKLFDRKIGSEMDYLISSNDRLNAEREYNDLKNSINAIIGEMNALEAKRQAFVSNWYTGIGEKLAAAIKKRTSQKEELSKLQKRKDNVEVIAPADGIIIDMQNIYTGGVVSEGDIVMTLVPTNVPLSVEIDIDPRDISLLFVGADISVKLDAMPYQKHGDLQAAITFISEDTVTESLSGDKGTFYRIHAQIGQNNMHALPEDFRLVPGMLFTGDIKVGQRRLITYFLYPVLRTLETSFTEPS